MTADPDQTPNSDVPIVKELRTRKRFRKAITTHLNRSVFALTLLSIPVGIIAAYGASGFRFAFGWMWSWLHTTGGMSDAIWQWAGLAIGGFLLGLVLMVLKWDSFRTLAHVIVAAQERGGKLTLKEGIITAVADAFALALGAAVGRYGPAVQLGATIGSYISQKTGLTRAGMRVLLGSGVAGAISASFNAPIAGAIFAHEVIVGHFALRAFAPIALSSVAAIAVTRYHGFEYIALKLHDVHRTLGLWDYPMFAIIGALTAGIALVYMRGILSLRSACNLSRVPLCFQTMAGGMIAGTVGIFVPGVLGLRDHTVQQLMEQDITMPAFTLGMIAALLLGKLVASVACLGCRFPGGVFSPSLFIGAMAGGISGVAAPFLDFQICVLVGMGAMVASVVGAPLATILIVFELTENYQAATAVMVGVVASNAIVTRFFAPSIFDRQVRIWGYDFKRPPQQRIMERQDIRHLVSNDYFAVLPSLTADEIITMFDEDFEGDIYVVEHTGKLLGKLHFPKLIHAAPNTTASELCKPPRHCLIVSDNSWHAFTSTQDFVGYSIPVVEDKEQMILQGIVHESDFITAYRKAVAEARKNHWS